eukprot:Partr_v1_DN27621_c0_g2_i2_m65352 putative CXXC finger protein 1
MLIDTKFSAPAPVYCICQATEDEDDSVMIACDQCDEWFHLHCIKYSEEDAERIDSFKCQSCTGGDSPAIEWKVKCANDIDCRNLLSSHSSSKYCSQTCGIAVNRRRLPALLKSSNVRIDRDSDKLSETLRLKLDTLNAAISARQTAVDELRDRLQNLASSVLFANTVSLLYSSDPKAALCGYHQAIEDPFLRYSPLSAESVGDSICMSPRNKCLVHGKVKTPMLEALEFPKSPPSNFPVDVVAYESCLALPLPYWAATIANKTVVELQGHLDELIVVKSRAQKITGNLETCLSKEFQIRIETKSGSIATITVSTLPSSTPQNRRFTTSMHI